MTLRQKLLHNSITREIGIWLHKAVRTAQMRFYTMTEKVDPMKVIFSSFEGRSYNDNPRYISEMLHERCPEAKIVWVTRSDDVALPDYVTRTRIYTPDCYRHMASARVWVTNQTIKPYYLLNTRRQDYINTWHGDRGFKKVGYDNAYAKQRGKRLEERCTFMLSGSDFGSRVIRTAFRNPNPWCIGAPRNDLLIRGDDQLAQKVREQLGARAGARLLLYAPTYRDDAYNDFRKQKSMLDISATLDFLEKRTGEPWQCLYRTHYLSDGLLIDREQRLIDACKWPEMAEILLISDLVITDYSSCGSDFMLQGRPAVYYQSDVDDYLENSRTFYFDMEKSPLLIAHSQQELEEILASLTPERVREYCAQVKAFFGEQETGRATELVTDRILEWIGK